MRRACLRAAPALLTLAAGLVAGCGGPGAGHVSGKVLLQNGRPLPGGTVTFYPVERGQDRNPVTATVKPDGTYDAPAVPVGEVRIAVSNSALNPRAGNPAFAGGLPAMPPGMKMPGPNGPPKGIKLPTVTAEKQEGTFVPLDPRFGDPEKSGLTFEVRPGDQTHDIPGISALGKAPR